MSSEECSHCGELTGKAGKGEDSLYDVLERGPFCETCWSLTSPLCNYIFEESIDCAKLRNEIWGSMSLEEREHSIRMNSR